MKWTDDLTEKAKNEEEMVFKVRDVSMTVPRGQLVAIGEWEDGFAAGFDWGDKEYPGKYCVWECGLLPAECLDTGLFYSQIWLTWTSI